MPASFELDLDEGVREGLLARWYTPLERLTALPARTPAGLRAKAEAAYAAMTSLEDFDIDKEEASAISVLRDLTGRA